MLFSGSEIISDWINGVGQSPVFHLLVDFVKTFIMVSLPGLNPVWSSVIISSALALSLFMMMFIITLLG